MDWTKDPLQVENAQKEQEERIAKEVHKQMQENLDWWKKKEEAPDKIILEVSKKELTENFQAGLTILKKDAALEVYKTNKKVVIMSGVMAVSSIALVFLNKSIAYMVVSIPLGLAAFYFITSNKRMNQLNDKYSLGFKKIEVKK